MQNLSDSPPRAPPIKYIAPLGTRWANEMAAAGGAAAFDLQTDPKTIGPWILGDCVGKGASGRVKIAKHRRTGQLAAVKILPIAPLITSRTSLATQQLKSDKLRLGIDREIIMMKLMSHPNIMRLYDVYEGDKELFLVLEYVEGGELFDYLVNRGKLSAREAIVYFRQIVYGLNYAHAFSIIHRDLKPENILIASLSPPLIKIADWGMAAFAPSSLQLETSCGSPHYASPEIVKGERYQGNATDIWSCGVILYALLTGHLPFEGKDMKTLLLKVQCGKYEMPDSIDPMAKDLISKMLVVDAKQRITIPQILAHPWLMSRQAIQVHGYDFKIYTILPPPLPPSPSILAQPIPSSDLIDPELFTSLRIIWGRHADPKGECILRDLCSPPGYGVYAKAFYFLLTKYRDESFKNHKIDVESECHVDSLNPDLGILASVAALESPTSTNGGLRKYEVSNVFLDSLAAHYGARSSANKPMTSRRRAFMNLRSEPLVARQPANLHLRSQIPTPLRDVAPIRPKSAALGGFGRRTSSKPFPLQLNYPQSMYPENFVGETPTPRFPQRQQYEKKVGASDLPEKVDVPKRRATELGPVSDLRQSVALPRSLANGKETSPVNRTFNAMSPTTVEQITKQMGDLGRNSTETPSVDVDPSKRSNIPKMRRYRKPREKDNKENQAVDEDWRRLRVDTNLGKVGLGVGDVNTNRDMGKDLGDLPLAKMKKTRPPPLELVPKRSTVTTLASPTVLSPTQFTSGANRGVTSPVVNDFKGWFSNLFNWKTSSANGGVLYSSEDLMATRATVSRILEGMGVLISKVQGDFRIEGAEYLIGRIENSSIDSTSGLFIKNVRFRIEFRTNPEAFQIYSTSPGVVEAGHQFILPIQYNLNSLNSPDTPVSVAGTPLSSRARTSFLLGGRSAQNGTPLPSPALVSASAKGDLSFPPGCLCAVAVVYEKGSMSTFKLIWRRLKEEYGEDFGGGAYPCLSPNIPNTPFVDGQRELVV